MLWNADHRWGACHKPIPQVPGGHLCLSRLRLCFTSNKDALLSCGCGLGIGVVPSYAKGSPLGSLNVLWNKQDAEHSIYPKVYRCNWGLGITKLREDSVQSSQNTLVVERQPPSQSANWPLYLCVFPAMFSLVTWVLGEAPESVWFPMMILDGKEGRGKLRSLPVHKLLPHWQGQCSWPFEFDTYSFDLQAWLLVSQLTLSMLAVCLTSSCTLLLLLRVTQNDYSKSKQQRFCSSSTVCSPVGATALYIFPPLTFSPQPKARGKTDYCLS